jgi:valyl-tRNA synthetase
MQTVMDVITGIRNVRGEMNISPSTALNVAVNAESSAVATVVETNRGLIENLARLNGLTVDTTMERPKAAATVLVGGATVYVMLEGIIDFSQEQTRLQKEIDKLTKDLSGMNKKLGNEDFLKKAPTDVVAGVRDKHAATLEKQHALEATLERITAMME